MRDVLDELVLTAEERGRALVQGAGHIAERKGKRIDHLLSIIRERFEAGDALARDIPSVAMLDTLQARHAAAVKACEEAVTVR